MSDDPHHFDSPQDLQALLSECAARLHYINRVGMGESRFVWWYADLLRAASRLAPMMTEREVTLAFGDGYRRGTAEDPRALILAMLAEQMSRR